MIIEIRCDKCYLYIVVSGDKTEKRKMRSISYKTISVVLATVIAMMGATTSVHASVDCSVSKDSRCLQSTMLPQDHHGNITAYCLFGSLLGTWEYPTNTSIPSTAYCRLIP
jgi:hypothetical protein